MLLISAAVIDFGCVAQGFTYSIDAVVTNNDSRLQRIKVTTVNVSGPDINKVSASTSSQAFAPGMTAVVKVELRAEVAARTSEYVIIVLTEGFTEELRLRVKSVIIPMEIFKYFAKTLRLQKRPGQSHQLSNTLSPSTMCDIQAAFSHSSSEMMIPSTEVLIVFCYDVITQSPKRVSLLLTL